MIPAVVLAAGMSTRMGRVKAMLPLDERDTFLTRIVRTFQQATGDVVVVVGCEAQQVMADAEGRGVSPRFVVNRHFETGQLSSVLAGLGAVDRPGVRGLLLTLVDVPMVDAATVHAVIARYRETGAPVVRPVRGELHGHPVLIASSLFDELRRADAASGGAKPIVRAHASAAGDVPVEHAGAFLDVDTPQEYDRLLHWIRGGARGWPDG